MNLNFWQNFFLNNFGSAFTYLDTAVQVIAFIVLFILLPILVYLCQKNILRCYEELKRQNHHLQNQGQCLDEINRWMQYFIDKSMQSETGSPPEKPVLQRKKRPSQPAPQKEPTIPSTPVSPYKKII